MTKQKSKSKKVVKQVIRDGEQSGVITATKEIPKAILQKLRSDEFVMTISDDEEGVPDLDEDDDLVNVNGGIEGQGASLKRGREESPYTQRRKRKLEEEEYEKKSKSGKKNKKDGKKGKGAHAEEDDEGEEEGGKEKKKGDDGGMDSDFEFRIGSGDGVVAEFDGWGFEGSRSAMNGDKKAVDIDDIIRRRKLRQKEANGGLEASESDDEEADHEDEEEEEAEEDSKNEDDEDEDENELEIASDDEDLAAGGFGMGANSDDEEDAQINAGSESEEENEESAPKEAVSDSDSESEASVAPHHLDNASDSDSDSDTSQKGDTAAEAARKAAYFAPESAANPSAPLSTTFQNMNLSRPILRGLASVGFTTPTAIQSKTIPVALLGKDVVGGAVTGSGKTAAFVVPILERLLYRPKKVPTSRVLILCPTRELAMQAHSVATKLAAFTDIKICAAVGGLSLKVQEAELKLRPDIIIATPGRFIDHMRNTPSLTIETIEILVMDEADRMLEDGFADELNEIISSIPKSRQTMLFSATMTDSIDKLITLSLNRPVRLMIDTKKSTVSTLTQEFIRIRPTREPLRLAMLLHLALTTYRTRTIIFFRSKAFAHRARIIFSLFNLKSAELHGALSQEGRIKSVELFRDNKVDFLLCTDLASRGLDIKGVETVINYETPQSHEIYLHRVGRTARAGRSGRAVTLAAESDRKIVKAAIKSARTQHAKIVSRILDPVKLDKLHSRIEALSDEIEQILAEEREEKQLSQVEMQLRKGENLIKHEAEIHSRPKRTWFESEKDKKAASELGKARLNGLELPAVKERLSGKKKRKLDMVEDREGGRMYKKTKGDRAVGQIRGVKKVFGGAGKAGVGGVKGNSAKKNKVKMGRSAGGAKGNSGGKRR